MDITPFLTNLRTVAAAVEQAAITAVARTAPWLSPLPTAYLVYDRTVVHLAWPRWVGWMSAVTLEFLGLATTITLLELYDYNRTKRKSDPTAPVLLTGILTALYFISAEGLTVILDVATKPQSTWIAADFAPAIFPLLSLAGVVLLAVRSDHNRRLETIKADKEQRRLARQQRKQRGQPDRTTAGQPGTTGQLPDSPLTETGQPLSIFDIPWTTLDPDDRTGEAKQLFLETVRGNGGQLDGVTPKRLSELTGRSVRTARRWLQEVNEKS